MIRTQSPTPTFLATLALLFCAPSPAHSSTVLVPSDWPTIQAALSLSSADTILVAEGIYPEQLEVRRGVVLRGLSPTVAHTVIDGLFLTGGPVRIERCRLRGPLRMAIEDPFDAFITECVLDSGIVDDSGRQGHSEFLFGCTISGSSALRARSAYVDSNTFLGELSLDVEGFRITRNTFTGPMPFAIQAMAVNSGIVTGNEVRDAGAGMRLETFSRLEVTDNTVIGCRDGGIAAYSETDLLLSNNLVDDSRHGIIAREAAIIAIRNRILRTDLNGFEIVTTRECTLEENVVGRSGGHGMLITCDTDCFIRRNTVYENQGDGLRLDAGSADGEVAGNIFYGNRGHGLSWWGDELSEPTCNDLFANGAGDLPSPGNLSVDPGFCDLVNDDVHLNVTSPLLSVSECGPVGAFGSGCDATTAALVQSFSARWRPEGLELRWEVEGARVESIERSESQDGPWERAALEHASDGAIAIGLDRSADANLRSWYRLLLERDGHVIVGAMIEVGPVGSPSFEILRLSPNPTRAHLRVDFQVGTTSPIEIALFDVQGRHVDWLARGVWTTGQHSIDWTRQAGVAQPAPGIYFVRFRHLGGEATERIMLAP